MKLLVIRFVLLASLVSVFHPVFVTAEEKKSAQKGDLIPGQSLTGLLELSDEGAAYQTFQFKVPSSAFGVRISISNSPADLDIFIKKGEEIQNYDLVDYSGTLDDFNESLFITRLSDTPLEDGVYYVDISYQRDIFPVVDGRRVTSIPFSVTMELLKYNVEDTLIPGRVSFQEITPSGGMAALFALKIPEYTSAFRVDLFNTTADLDLLVAYKNKNVSRSNSDYIGESLLGKETLIIEGDNGGFVKAGVYYFLVFDQVSNDHPVSFSILTGLNRDPSSLLTEIPRFPSTGDELQNALMATTEIIANSGKGTGCLVGPSGYIITNWHVIEDYSGSASKDIFVAVNFSNELPPSELFKAELVDYSVEKDLALLKISTGLYGQILPYNYKFPYFNLGSSDSLKIGQPLTYLGYPGVGGTGSRASISLTRGIVSGFEKNRNNRYIKTDGEINSGNSGGAAINTYYELVGFPTVTIGEDSGQLAYLTPVSMIPREWYRYIGK